ncbi:hypothetical protein DPMN_169062 [Dreissena polymorpha]|uniref:Uncharacterized protein n=1 Tax=Dreissena polymorpha TaxID=45954 RepID=A0A9D4F1V8_DREPO|nr:hypothetical protein DPMN_169062 [Dreissena polymorpha]
MQAEKLFPCETSRGDTPLQKVIAMKTGKEVVDKYFEDKNNRRSSSLMSPKTGVQASKCTCKKAIYTPKPSGTQITEATFLQQLYEYEHAKETRTGTTATNPKSPQPSTIGIHNNSIKTTITRAVCKTCMPPYGLSVVVTANM